MKFRALIVSALMCSAQLTQAAPGGRIAIPDLRALESKASESVDVTLDEHLLGMAGRFLDAGNPEEANARKIIEGLQGVYVRSYSFDADYVPPPADIDAIRKQLVAPQWSRIVGVRSRKENTSIEVYLLVEGQLAKGLAVLALEPRKFTVVNIVGAIDLDKLRRIEGQLGVPKLDIESPQVGNKSDRKPAGK